MFISKKKLEKRIKDLEDQQTVNTFSYGEVGLKKLAQIIDAKNKRDKKINLECRGEIQSQQNTQGDVGVVKTITLLPDSPTSLTQVSFQLSTREWKILKKTKEWRFIELFIYQEN